jgi:hypothetical protein
MGIEGALGVKAERGEPKKKAQKECGAGSTDCCVVVKGEHG